METIGHILLGLCVIIFWYLDGIFSVGLFVNSLEPSHVSIEKWNRRKIFFALLALLGPILHALFLIYVAFSIIVVLVCLPGRRYTLTTVLDWCFLGLKDINEEMTKMEELDS